MCIRDRDYSSEVHAYTRGLGHLTLELSGYDVCHNSEEVIAGIGYDSEAEDVYKRQQQMWAVRILWLMRSSLSETHMYGEETV